jgi:hypothetical protein
MTQRQGLFGGLAVLSCGTVVLQIALTRLYSALFGHHLAFLAISLSLFGVGLGGVLLYVFPGLCRPPALFARLSYLSGLASAATVGALLSLLHVKPIEKLDASSLLSLAVLYLSSSLPFVLAGIAVAGAIRHAARDISRLYLVDLAGAAIGGLGAIAALRAGALRACLIVAIIEAMAALLFWAGSRGPSPEGTPRERRANGGVIATFVLATCVLLAGDVGAPWLKLPALRWISVEKVEFQAWNEMALITVDKASGGMAWMRMDGSAATAILDPKTTPPLHPDEMAYILHKEKGPVLVIGAGGGRDIRSALKYGQKEIYAAEINPIIVNDVMKGHYKTWTGDLFGKPEVHVTVADGRSYVRASERKFRNVVISLVDTSAAASVGALALTENSLYTVEAFRDYLDHLTPEGTLIVNRWDGEFDRLLALGVAGLGQVGVTNPKAHMFACGAARSTALLIKRTPLAQDEIATLRRHCKKNKFAEAFAPDEARTELRRRLVSGVSAANADPDHATDLSPPTDDRPFFFYTVPTRRLLAVLGDLPALQADNQALLTLLGLLVVSVTLALIFLLGPLVLRRAAEGGGAVRGPRARPLLFFFCLGGGFVFVEVALVQHFVMFLGHPVYALSTVLLALLLWAGIGSLLTARVRAVEAAASAGVRAQLLVASLALYAVILGPVLDQLVGLPFGARLGVTLGMLAPLGLLMGAQAPLGVKLIDARSPELIPWCWGINGVASVVATAVGTLLAMHLGFSALLLTGGLCYLVAAAAVPRAVEAAPQV